MSRNLARILILLVTMLVMTDVNLQAAGGGYLYALRDVAGGTNQIFGFQVNELSGALTALSGFPVSTPVLAFTLKPAMLVPVLPPVYT